MTTFRLDEVTVAEVEARLDRCDAGAEAGCETVDGTLLCYAKACHEVREATRAWGLAVFAGRVPPDAATERAWREAGGRVYGRAVAALLGTHRSDVPGAKADAQTTLRSALWELDQLLSGWVTPQLAVGPSARQRPNLTAEQIEAVRQRVAALPPRPVDWEAPAPEQRTQAKKPRPPHVQHG